MQGKIQSIMRTQIKEKIEKCIVIAKATDDNILILRKNVDMLASLMENFKIGKI